MNPMDMAMILAAPHVGRHGMYGMLMPYLHLFHPQTQQSPTMVILLTSSLNRWCAIDAIFPRHLGTRRRHAHASRNGRSRPHGNGHDGSSCPTSDGHRHGYGYGRRHGHGRVPSRHAWWYALTPQSLLPSIVWLRLRTRRRMIPRLVRLVR
jgi:hypothetical protein